VDAIDPFPRFGAALLPLLHKANVGDDCDDVNLVRLRTDRVTA